MPLGRQCFPIKPRPPVTNIIFFSSIVDPAPKKGYMSFSYDCRAVPRGDKERVVPGKSPKGLAAVALNVGESIFEYRFRAICFRTIGVGRLHFRCRRW
jgi:hypothetical protein